MPILPTDELVIHRAGNDYRSAVSTLPVADFTLSDVLTNGNLADSFQAIRFKTSEAAPDPDSINPDPNILSDGIGSAHRSLYSAWTAFVPGTGGLHSDANSSYFVNYILDEDAAPLGIAKVSAGLGFYLYQKDDVALNGDNGFYFSVDGAFLDYNDNFRVDLTGNVTAASFAGDGSLLTNLPLDGYATEIYVTDAINAIPLPNFSDYAKLVDVAQSITALEFIGDGSKLTNLTLTGYATETYVTDAINAIPLPNFSDFAKLVDVTQSITALEFIGDGSKLTNLTLTGYATETYVTDAINAIPGADLAPYAKLVDPDRSITADEFIEFQFRAFKNYEDNIEFLSKDIKSMDEKIKEVQTKMA